ERRGASMKIKPVFTYDSQQKQVRVFRCLWQRGTVGDGEGFSAQLSVSLLPSVGSFQRAWHDIAVVILGLRLHYKRSYGGMLELGQPGYHLPTAIRWPTAKSRLGKHGYYLIIPFRHGTPGTKAGSSRLPRRIYAVARQLQPGQRLTAGPTAGRAVHAPGLTPYQ